MQKTYCLISNIQHKGIVKNTVFLGDEQFHLYQSKYHTVKIFLAMSIQLSPNQGSLKNNRNNMH